MSRIGKHAVVLPAGVTASVKGQDVAVKGKLGELKMRVDDALAVESDGKSISVKPRGDVDSSRMIWGTNRAKLANLVKGVSEGFSVTLEMSGVGFRSAVQGKELAMQLGFSHEVKFTIPDGISAKVDKQTVIILSGADKQAVGQAAANIRSLREPEPYKGKGIKYSTEVIRRKEGKKK